MIDYHEKILPRISQPWYASSDELHGLVLDVSRSTPVSGALTTLLTPAMEAAYAAFNRDVATVRCLRIVNALGDYAQANGREAAGLDDLNLPVEVSRDPFSGQSLRLKRTDKAWVVYSVFKNGTDDGGDFRDQADWGLGPAGYAL